MSQSKCQQTPKHSRVFGLFGNHHGEWLMCVLLLAAGCAATGGTPTAREEIPRMLEQQAQAWNAGDIDAFMAPYWHSPDLTFSSGGKVTRGWQGTRDRYRQRYPTRP